jgi:hypothetical protein
VVPVNETTEEITPEADMHGVNKVVTQWRHFWLCSLVQEVNFDDTRIILLFLVVKFELGQRDTALKAIIISGNKKCGLD